MEIKRSNILYQVYIGRVKNIYILQYIEYYSCEMTFSNYVSDSSLEKCWRKKVKHIKSNEASS